MDSTPRLALLSLISLLPPIALAACSWSNDRTFDGGEDAGEDAGEDDTSDEGDSSDDSGDTDPDAGTTGEPEPEPFDCVMACTTLADGGCLTPDACVETCFGESPDWSEELRDAFTTCVATDPLCFTTLDQCLAQAIHPEGTEFPLAFRGIGFDAFEGMTIFVWHDPDAPASFGGSAPIVDGTFDFDWVEPVPVSTSGGPLLLWYVDVDGDASCSAADLKGSSILGWNQDLQEPAFSLEIEPPATSADFVCDFVP